MSLAISHMLPLDGRKVLLVDDCEDNQYIIKAFLTQGGAQVDQALNGAQGSEMALAQKYDVVLMDIQLPDMDGHEVTRRLRAKGYSSPILALTASSDLLEIKKAQDSGCSGFLSKPILKSRLIEALAPFQNGG